MTDIIESPDLQQLGKQALQDLLNNLTQAKAFAVDQAPEFCQQIIARGIYMPASVAALAGLISIISASVTAAALIGGKRSGWREDVWIAPAIIGAAATLISFLAAAHSAYSALRVYVAPKVFLVEELMRMVK